MRTFAPGFATAILVSALTTSLTGAYGQPQARSLTFQADKPKVAVITCMHPFLNMDFLLKQLNLTSNNSYILRNAGGRAKAAIRSVLVSQEFLGTSEVHVIHHTQCGMAGHSEESMRQKFYRDDDKYRAELVNHIDFLPIRTTNYTESVLNDVMYIGAHPLNKATRITGWVYNIHQEGVSDSITQVYPTGGGNSPSNANATFPSHGSTNKTDPAPLSDVNPSATTSATTPPAYGKPAATS